MFVSECNCKRCGATWLPRKFTIPKKCPKCQDPNWDLARVRGKRRTTAELRALGRSRSMVPDTVASTMTETPGKEAAPPSAAETIPVAEPIIDLDAEIRAMAQLLHDTTPPSE